MPDKNIFDRYLLALRKTPSDDKTEHTDRPALYDLLQAVAKDVARGLVVHHETKQKKIKGKPNGNDSAADKKEARRTSKSPAAA
jgi:alpha-ketoglutarate-dependent taurine dioxygenase